ncbi:unnamed protein product, partial [Didymodactylos carnosus]
FLVDIPLDLSRPTKSTIKILSSTSAPPLKRVVLDRQAGQLLTGQQALEQLKAKEERKATAKSAKSKREITSTKKCSSTKAKMKKKVTIIDDISMDTNESSTTIVSAPKTLSTTVRIPTSLTHVLMTTPVTTTYTSLSNMPQSSLTDLPLSSYFSPDPWHPAPGTISSTSCQPYASSSLLSLSTNPFPLPIQIPKSFKCHYQSNNLIRCTSCTKYVA